MKIFSAAQTRELDAYTIEQEPIDSIDLMERASLTFINWFERSFTNTDRPVQIFCGIGNNGGDGFAIARLLQQRFYSVEVYHCLLKESFSSDCENNRERLAEMRNVPIHEIRKGDKLPALADNAYLIDAFFGSGLNRPVEGYWAKLLEHLNMQKSTRIAVDIPSGLFADKHSPGICFQADYTLSFQMPKLAFFLPENYRCVGEWNVKNIGLHPDFIQQTEAEHHLIGYAHVRSLLKVRHKFDHKGTYGHALLVMGGYGKAGAAILAARACLRSGAGLVSVHVPKNLYPILQVSFPEAMISVDPHEFVFSRPPNLQAYQTIGTGCGLGTSSLAAEGLQQLLQASDKPMVLDADALNILGKHPEWLELIPKNSILTPHPKEFERLFGATENDFEELELQKKKAQELGIYLLIKRAYTSIATPEGICYFNNTGNPGMGTGGSGDVLTGVLAGLLAQGYTPLEACITGVFLHGLAGDIAAAELEQESLLASDLIEHLGAAFQRIRNSHNSHP